MIHSQTMDEYRDSRIQTLSKKLNELREQDLDPNRDTNKDKKFPFTDSFSYDMGKKYLIYSKDPRIVNQYVVTRHSIKSKDHTCSECNTLFKNSVQIMSITWNIEISLSIKFVYLLFLDNLID